MLMIDLQATIHVPGFHNISAPRNWGAPISGKRVGTRHRH
jgi:hypothetical protein